MDPKECGVNVMNQVFFFFFSTLSYVGGFGIMIFLLGILTELCIEIWDEKFRKICVRFEVERTDVLYYSQNRKDIETMFLKSRVRWPYTDNAPSGSWNCPECNALNQYVNDNKPVAYCRCCGQALEMNYYRRHANG